MKNFIVAISISLLFLTGFVDWSSFSSNAQVAYAACSGSVSVGGYYRSNGTYVRGHTRSCPDGNPYNNYSFPGNYNPNTGLITGGSQSTYLGNYYGSSSASPSDNSSSASPSYGSSSSSSSKTYFTIGSTKDDVLRLTGKPYSFSNTQWMYSGNANVSFDYQGKVSKWWDPNKKLKARLVLSSSSSSGKTYFTIGSTKDDVLRLTGKPYSFSNTQWMYSGNANVSFDYQGKVSKWWDPNKKLKAR